MKSSNLAPYYVYALKDPRTNPVLPFYIGKGTGNRAWEHTINVDSTRKGVAVKGPYCHSAAFLVAPTAYRRQHLRLGAGRQPRMVNSVNDLKPLRE
jgi:hypothetical protein